MMQCFKNAQVFNSVSIFDRAFHYGDGCFTTARIRQGKIELYDLHLARLQQGCQRLALNANLEHIQYSITQIAPDVKSVSGHLKIMISRGEGQRGYALPSHAADVWLMYYPNEIADFHADIISSGLLEQKMGLSMPSLVGVKSLNRLEQVLLKKEADERAWSEALVSDIQGYIVEGVSSNCFIRYEDRWMTPDLRYNGVQGVMRAEILARMQRQAIPCELGTFELLNIANIQSLFFCNALHPMKIVAQLDHQTLETQPCLDLFHRLQLQQMH